MFAGLFVVNCLLKLRFYSCIKFCCFAMLDKLNEVFGLFVIDLPFEIAVLFVYWSG